MYAQKLSCQFINRIAFHSNLSVLCHDDLIKVKVYDELIVLSVLSYSAASLISLDRRRMVP